MKKLIELLKQWSYDSTVTPNSFFLMLDETAESVFGGLDQPGAWWSRSGKFEAELPALSLERLNYTYKDRQVCFDNQFTIISDDCRDGLNSAEMEERLIYFLIDLLAALNTVDANGNILIDELFDESTAYYSLIDELKFITQRSANQIAVTVSYKECLCYAEQINAEPANRCSVCP